MERTSRIDPEAFRAMWEDQTPRAEIAKAFGVATEYVTHVARKLGLPPRHWGGKRQHVEVPRPGSNKPDPVPEKPASTIPGLTGELINTQGKYAALSAIGSREGWTWVQTIQRYHAAVRG